MDDGTASGIRSVDFLVTPDVVFGTSVTVRLAWPDLDNDGFVDGTTLAENDIRVAFDGVPLSPTCDQNPNCVPGSNYLDVVVPALGEFLLFVELDSDGDGVGDNFGGVIDNCALVSNPLQEDFDANGIIDACETPNLQCVPDNILLSSQADIDDFQLAHGPGCESITGNLVIIGPDISNLAGLSGVTSIGGFLRIEDNHSLQDLDGLSSLTSIVARSVDPSNGSTIYHELAILNNTSLQDCTGLRVLLDDVDDPLPGPGPGPDGIPDLGGILAVSGNLPGCNPLTEITTSLFFDGFESGSASAWSDSTPAP